MSLATATLPTDPETLRAFAARLQAELYAKTLHIEKLKAELALLKRARYGRSSERIDQLAAPRPSAPGSPRSLLRGVAAAGASATRAGRARSGLRLPGLRQHLAQPHRHG